ncbi:MAG: VOC family protein [Pseudoalteromonas sp.]|mgnify:CR=1 FL=1|uniref:VOC family protein n=1 Tax=Pseudoalteromonas TaxID=53246 RepID=UPI0013FD27C7|nr:MULTISPECIES: VOC family protein [unclassified Pseudoalteromonas]MBH0035629.1 VOC family protein [Pseudoalteromonas sp. NZS71_1]MBH0078676.1 VOC family protein [Pseudoalteromonas sp. NZS11]|tara:strand:- start:325 stop:810 length:486 start_codon:yes stop_codon:yes gene_type:complete
MLKKTLLLSLSPLLLLSASAISNTSQEVKSWVGGVDHLGLTVSNLDSSKVFFTDVLGFKTLGSDPTYPAYFLSNNKITITLWRVKNDEKRVEFNRAENVGLHHLALSVESIKKLSELHTHLKMQNNIIIEFAPENLGNGPTQHMMIREPSGNRIEFIARGN